MLCDHGDDSTDYYNINNYLDYHCGMYLLLHIYEPTCSIPAASCVSVLHKAQGPSPPTWPALWWMVTRICPLPQAGCLEVETCSRVHGNTKVSPLSFMVLSPDSPFDTGLLAALWFCKDRKLTGAKQSHAPHPS